MISDKSTIEILNEAADIIERDGWVAGTRHEYSTGRVCAIGALERAATGARCWGEDGYRDAEESCPNAMKALAAMVKAEFPKFDCKANVGGTIAAWSNSHTEADGAKKVACLMRAAALWEEEK